MDEEPELRTREWLPRTAALLVGTLALATAFIAAYVGALHQPTPRDVPVGLLVWVALGLLGLLTATLVRGRRAARRPGRQLDTRPDG